MGNEWRRDDAGQARRMQRLEERLAALERGAHLQNAGIGQGGITIRDAGSLTLRDGGGVAVLDPSGNARVQLGYDLRNGLAVRNPRTGQLAELADVAFGAANAVVTGSHTHAPTPSWADDPRTGLRLSVDGATGKVIVLYGVTAQLVDAGGGTTTGNAAVSLRAKAASSGGTYYGQAVDIEVASAVPDHHLIASVIDVAPGHVYLITPQLRFTTTDRQLRLMTSSVVALIS